MIQKIIQKLKSFSFFLALAVRSGAYATFLEYLLYRTPLAGALARWQGHDFHRSAMMWFTEKDGIHTRVVMWLPYIRYDFPSIETIDMELEFYSNGKLVKKSALKDLRLNRIFNLDSQCLPSVFDIPKPFDGVLLIKQRLHLDMKEILKVQGIFGSAHNYIDYYSEGSFVTTMHDYGAYLPDQGMNYGVLGMIPAYCNSQRETQLLFVSAQPGMGKRDMEVILLNESGAKKKAFFPGLKPYSYRRLLLAELFPDAQEFLAGRPGQIMIDGFFRKVLRRVAYGVVDKKQGGFSLDHCFYSVYKKLPHLSAEQRRLVSKGWFNPFLVLQDDETETIAFMFHDARDKEEQDIDLLVYDEAGRCVLSLPSYVWLSGDRIARIDVSGALKNKGISGPFMGHAELIYHEDSKHKSYPKDLGACIEYNRKGKAANVIIGAEPWNSSKAVENKLYNSGNRIVCNGSQTTYLAISNCSFDYDCKLEAKFTLNLMVDGKIAATRDLVLAAHATLYRAIDDIFPDARKLLADCGGVGYTTTTNVNCWALAHLFLTEDRKSRALSAEHSSDVGIFA